MNDEQDTPPIAENTNGNTNRNSNDESVTASVSEAVSDPGTAVTLAEAAARLSITLPRLTRLLKRAEFAGGVSKAERQTKTGTRTVTLVSVSVIEAVSLSLTEHKHEQYGPNHYRSPEAEGSRGEQREEGQLSPLAAALLNEREARLADKDAEIARLSETLSQTQAALQKALDGLGREQALRALPPPQSELGTGSEAGTAWDRIKRWFAGN